MPGSESEAMFYGLAAELQKQYSPAAVKGKGQAAGPAMGHTGGTIRDPVPLYPPECVPLPALRWVYSPASPLSFAVD